jgi:2,4-dienoyl-CoA reductase (NADPH2)
MSFTRYLSHQVNKLGVTVHTGTVAKTKTVEKEKPDVLIVAAGGSHRIPDIPGINSRKVQTSEKLHSKLKFFLKFTDPGSLRKLSKLWLPNIGKNVVILGGRLHGCQTAEYLVHNGRNVTIVDTGTKEEIGEGLIEVFLKPYLLYWLEDHATEFITEATYKEINKKGLVITTKEGTERTIEADTVITALPLVPNSEITTRMEGKAKEVYTIGDSDTPALIFEAVAAGAKIAREI